MTKKQKKVLIRIIIASVLIILLKLVFHFVNVNKYVELIAFLVPYFIIGYDILKKAVYGIFNRQVFDENFLMAIATVGAIALGEYVEGTAVMLFYQIGELFQSYAVGKSRKNITALMDIRPDYANIEVDGKLEQVDLVGYLVIVDKIGEQADNGQHAENNFSCVHLFTSFQLSEKFSTASMMRSTTAPTA